MHREQILWSHPAKDIRLRGRPTEIQSPAAVPTRPAAEPVAASFPDQSGNQVKVAVSPAPDIRPLLEALGNQLDELDQRRQQSLQEMQQVALDLALAVASHLVFQAIDRDQHNVEELVRQAVQSMGAGASLCVALHPKDLELLQRSLGQHSGLWDREQVQLQGDPGIARGGCRVEGGDGRMLVSDIGVRLSEIRRHWMEELDDSQVERRRPAGEGTSMRRFPDRRETA